MHNKNRSSRFIFNYIIIIIKKAIKYLCNLLSFHYFSYNPAQGFAFRNEDQTTGMCRDFKVQLGCSCSDWGPGPPHSQLWGERKKFCFLFFFQNSSFYFLLKYRGGIVMGPLHRHFFSCQSWKAQMLLRWSLITEVAVMVVGLTQKQLKIKIWILNMFCPQNVFMGTRGFIIFFSALTFLSFQWLRKHETTNEEQIHFCAWAYTKLWLDVNNANVQYMFWADGGD